MAEQAVPSTWLGPYLWIGKDEKSILSPLTCHVKTFLEVNIRLYLYNSYQQLNKLTTLCFAVKCLGEHCSAVLPNAP